MFDETEDLSDFGASVSESDVTHVGTDTHDDDFLTEEHSARVYSPSFGRLMDDIPDGAILAPYDELGSSSPGEIFHNPLGVYTVKNLVESQGLPDVEYYDRYDLPRDFSAKDIQEACNLMCDSIHWDHINIAVTDSVANAQWSSGLFLHRTFDDLISLNPLYANDCIEHLNSTDIVMSDLAHEIGHSVAFNICGDMGTYMNEKMADFISGFINAKMGVNIDVARQWFEWYYDPNGRGGYPISEERWDAEAAGYYFASLVNGDVLQSVLKDQEFLNIIEAYSQDKLDLISETLWQTSDDVHCAEQSSSFHSLFVKSLRNQLHKFGPAIYCYLRNLHFHL